jgi:hypothetical protein
VEKVVTGVVSALEPRSNDWVAVHIMVPGKQYPVKLSTKRPELIGLAQSVVGQNVDALYNEEQGTQINPHNNQPYINRYLEQLAPAGSIPPPVVPVQQQVPQASFQGQPQGFPQAQQQAGTAPGWPTQQPQQFGNLQPQLPPQPVAQYAPQPEPTGTMRHVVVDDDQRENRIMRQAATKVAAVFLPMLNPEDQNLGSLIRISEQLLKYYREGVSWETNPPPVPAQVPQPQADGRAGYENPNEYPDPGPEPGDPGPVPVGEFPQGY